MSAYLDVNSVALFVYLHVCRQWYVPMLAEFPLKHVTSATSVTFRVCHVSNKRTYSNQTNTTLTSDTHTQSSVFILVHFFSKYSVLNKVLPNFCG